MNKKIKVETDTPKIDSLTIWIKREKCKILDERLITQTATYYIDADTYGEENPPKPIIIKDEKKGITLRIRLKQIAERKYIDLTITSKMLGTQYFKGINKTNIKGIYNQFIEMEIFECTFETFINSLVMDIDICQNHYIKEYSSFDKITQTIKILVDNDNIVNRISQNQNKGIEISTREKATYKKPYVKIYFKEIELYTKSKIFKDEYLKNYNIENLIRTESTIKNGKIIKQLVKNKILPEFKTLGELLLIENQEFKKFINWSINQHTNTKEMINENTNTKELTPMELIIQTYMRMLIQEENYSTDEIITYGKNSYTNENKNTQKQTRARNKKLLEKLTKSLQEQNEEIRKIFNNEKDVKNYLKSIGIEI